MSKNIQQANMLICNFCEKAKNEVNKLIVADGAAICNECIETCSGIITNEKYTARYKKSGIFKSLDPLRVVVRARGLLHRMAASCRRLSEV